MQLKEEQTERHRRTQEDVNYAAECLEQAMSCDDRDSQLAQVMPLIMLLYDARYVPEAKGLLKKALELALLANSEIPTKGR